MKAPDVSRTKIVPGAESTTPPVTAMDPVAEQLMASYPPLVALVTTLQSEADHFRAELNELRSEYAETHRRMAMEIAQLKRAEAERDRLRGWAESVQAELAATRQHAQALETSLDRIARREPEGAAEPTAAAVTTLCEDLAETHRACELLDEELADAHRARRSVETMLAARETELARQREVTTSLATVQQRLMAERGERAERLARLKAQLRHDVETRETALAAAQQRSADLDIELRRLAEKSERERTETAWEAARLRDELAATRQAYWEIERKLFQQAPAPASGAGDGTPDTTTTTEKEVLVVDEGTFAEELTRQLGASGLHATYTVGDVELGLELGVHRVTAVALNLALPDVWGAVRRLGGGPAARADVFLAYACAPGANVGIWLGPVSFAIMPLDRRRLAAILSRMVPELHRVVVISSDPDLRRTVGGELRTERIASSFVSSGGEALRVMLETPHEATIVHLSPRCRDAFRSLWALRIAQEAQDIPILFLLDEAADPRDVAFLTDGMCELAKHGHLGVEALAHSVLADLAARPRAGGESTPASRLH